MINHAAVSIFIALAAYVGGATLVSADDLRFTGKESTDTAAFEMSGPWLLDWSARAAESASCNLADWAKESARRVPCTFELRLVDADNGQPLGTIAKLLGEAHGSKLFENPGRYKIEVVAQDVRWELVISPVTEATAARLKFGPTMADRSREAASRVAEGSFVSWRPLDDQTLLLFSKDETTGFRVTFGRSCAGLSQATALSFVTALEHRAEVYDSILLDDGRQCYFDQVIPTVFK